MAERRRSHTEEESLSELATTEIAPGTARALTWGFVTVILAVPLLQISFEAARGQLPQVLGLFTPFKESAFRLAEGRWGEAAQVAQPVLTATYLHDYEDRLETASLPRRVVQTHLQALLARFGRVGNEKCLIGRKGWLFYQPGIDYVTGPNFLDESRLRVQAKNLEETEGVSDPQPDPRPAILRLQEDCRRAGVHLVVVPIPDKAMLQPVQLTRRIARTGQHVPNNPGFARLVRELREQGVDVLDPTPPAIAADQPLYLKQDTHWLPSFMQQTAMRLADHVQRTVALPPVEQSRMCILEKLVARPGDLVSMLRLSEAQTLYPLEQVVIRQVVELDKDRPWAPDRQADVLLLGDSFTNIYSDGEGNEGLGWGRSAGLAAHLSYYLDRPVDVIARNGAGATQVRGDLARRPDPLDGKRVVLWQFAIRDLAQADWKLVRLSGRGARPGGDSPSRPADTESLVVQATVVAVSRVPRPYTVTYKDCLTYIKVRVEQVEAGRFSDEYLIAAFWGMKNNNLQPAAHYRPGDRFRLKLITQQRVSDQLQGIRVADDLDDYEHQTFYVQEASRP